jgi:hypothetical protein
MANAKNSEDTAKALEGELVEMLQLQTEVAQTEAGLMENPEFRAFLSRKKEVDEQLAAFWKRVESEMIQLDIKTIKGPWGSLTIAERQNWKIDEAELPGKFFKKVVDTSRITKTYQLEGKPIKGAEPYTTKYLTKRLKDKE